MEPRYDADFYKIFHNNLVGMVLTNEQHLITDINDNVLKLIGLGKENVIGKTALEAGVLNEDNVKQMWQQLAEKGELINTELAFKTKQNKPLTILLSTEKIQLNGSCFWLTSIIDITERKKTAQSLSELYERVSDGFIAIDRNWIYTYVNKRAGELLGKAPAYLIGKNMWVEFPQEETNPFYRAYHQAMETQQMVTVEEYVEVYGKWFQNLIYPASDGLSVFFHDITDSKENEKKIIESEMRFRTLTKTAPVGIFETDGSGSTTYVNETWLQYTGMHFEEAVGDGWLDAVHPDDREWLQKGWHSKTEMESVSFSEYRLVDKQGRQRWVNGKAAPVFYADGKVRGYVGIILDVTERKKTEEKIAESELRFRTLAKDAPVGIFETDANGLTTYVNQTWLNYTGLTFEEAIGDAWMYIIHPDDRQNQVESWKNKIKNIEPSETEYRIINKNGELRWVNGKAIPVINSSGKVTGYIGTIADVTEVKTALELLNQRTEQLSELSTHLQNIREKERMYIAREIHDELGQQLTALKMDIAWLSKKNISGHYDVKNKFEDAITLVDETVKSIRRIATELRPSIIDDLGLNAALEWQVTEFSQRSGILVSFKNDFDDANINPAISIGLFRILQESLTNIARHSQAKKVWVGLEKSGNSVLLSIQDDGIGFDATLKKNGQTFGLLGIKERAVMLKGKCSINSTPHGGTNIAVQIPLH